MAASRGGITEKQANKKDTSIGRQLQIQIQPVSYVEMAKAGDKGFVRAAVIVLWST